MTEGIWGLISLLGPAGRNYPTIPESPGAFAEPCRVTDPHEKPETPLYVLARSIPQSNSEGAFTKQAKRCA
jgi:hypothetical protein